MEISTWQPISLNDPNLTYQHKKEDGYRFVDLDYVNDNKMKKRGWWIDERKKEIREYNPEFKVKGNQVYPIDKNSNMQGNRSIYIRDDAKLIKPYPGLVSLEHTKVKLPCCFGTPDYNLNTEDKYKKKIIFLIVTPFYHIENSVN